MAWTAGWLEGSRVTTGPSSKDRSTALRSLSRRPPRALASPAHTGGSSSYNSANPQVLAQVESYPNSIGPIVLTNLWNPALFDSTNQTESLSWFFHPLTEIDFRLGPSRERSSCQVRDRSSCKDCRSPAKSSRGGPAMVQIAAIAVIIDTNVRIPTKTQRTNLRTNRKQALRTPGFPHEIIPIWRTEVA